MKETPLFFATTNPYKFQEFERLFSRLNVKLEHIDIAIPEVQTFDFETIIKDKVVKAYSSVSRPILVDHSGLGMKALKELPQGLNNQFWDKLKDQVCDLAQKLGDDEAEIIVYLGFCDGQRIYSVSQRDKGRMAPKPATIGTFHIDRVFIPDGSTITLAEMSEVERDKISHRRKVTEKAVELFKKIDFGRKLGLK